MARVLIVEDNRNLAHGLRTNLEFEGHRAEIASDGDAGLRRARSGEHDIVVLDLKLPDSSSMDGVAAFVKIGTRVVVFTAYDAEDDVFRAIRGGARGYLLKGSPAADISDAVEKLGLARQHFAA